MTVAFQLFAAGSLNPAKYAQRPAQLSLNFQQACIAKVPLNWRNFHFHFFVAAPKFVTFQHVKGSNKMSPRWKHGSTYVNPFKSELFV